MPTYGKIGMAYRGKVASRHTNVSSMVRSMYIRGQVKKDWVATPLTTRTKRSLSRNRIAHSRLSGIGHRTRSNRAKLQRSITSKHLGQMGRRAPLGRNAKVGLAIGAGTLAVGVGVYAYKRHKKTVISRNANATRARAHAQKMQARTRHRRTNWRRDSHGHFT